jgi:exopolysaccharide production protein ExoZ
VRQGGEIRMVQALRAAACLLVVLYHALQAGRGEAAIAAWPNGSAGVDLFFVISGYVMVASSGRVRAQPGGWRVFLRHRARRIVPLYWMVSFIKLAAVVAAPALAPATHAGAWNVIASLCFIPARDALGQVRPLVPIGWTLNFEAFFYILFAASLAGRRNPLWTTPILLAVAVAGFWRAPSWPAPLFLANGMVLEFAAGMALASLPGGVAPRAAPWVLAGGAILLLTLPLAGPWRFLVWGVPAAAILVAALALERMVRVPAWVVSLGDASFAIYLVHPFIVAAIARYAGWPAVIPASVITGLMVHRWVDAPVQRWLKGRVFFFEKKNQKTFIY